MVLGQVISFIDFDPTKQPTEGFGLLIDRVQI